MNTIFGSSRTKTHPHCTCSSCVEKYIKKLKQSILVKWTLPPYFCRTTILGFLIDVKYGPNWQPMLNLPYVPSGRSRPSWTFKQLCSSSFRLGWSCLLTDKSLFPLLAVRNEIQPRIRCTHLHNWIGYT